MRNLVWGSAVVWGLGVLSGCGETSSNGSACAMPSCAGASSGGAHASSGGAKASGGARASGGSPSVDGGAPMAEGGANEATGGAPENEGGTSNSSGGVPATGGVSTGGATASGGVPANGGTATTGGVGNYCTPGAKICEDNSIYQCNPGGTGRIMLEHCLEVSQSCDWTTFTCVPRICTPNVSHCEGTSQLTCNALGTAFDSKDCTAEGKICSNNQCRAHICEPSTRFCDGDTLSDCNSLGTEKASVIDCSLTSSHCVQNGTSAECRCTPGALDCNGNSIVTCSPDGKSWIPTEDCPGGHLCRAGACLRQTCTPSFPGFFCSGREIRQCIDGIESSLTTTCGDGYSCFVGDGVLGCLRSVCDSGTPSCLANQFGTCGADGDTLSSVSDDCAARGLVCNAAGCTASAVDVLGSPDEARHFDGGLVGDFLTISTDANPFADSRQAARTLTRIEAYLRVASPVEATWEVYEWSPNRNFPTVELSKTTSVSGTGYQDSGPLDFRLDPINDSIVTVRLSGSFDAFQSARSDVTLTSFGQLQEGVVGPYEGDWQGDAEHVFAFRVTTSASQ